ncbi:phage major capsid protein [Fictibacillus enclensis]|uniref:phage major capsid protein n=1 Tax=Fictibacillus enclensis TaxID=1017270 RepID=UPI0025A23718|nr:phage major capsid protein [Fictibacillus enclensis]MDM5199249.1 phage major capsid protein [Fictibacillus enclensis]
MTELQEQKNNLLNELDGLFAKIKEEKRAFNDEESTRYDEIEKELAKLDKTMKAEERSRSFEKEEGTNMEEKRSAEDIFSDFIKEETRAAGEMTKTANGNIIPTELSNDIIKRVSELSGIFAQVRRIDSTGKYQQIIEKNKVTAGWTDEMAQVTKTSGDYDIIEIDHYKLAGLTTISLEVLNQANFNVSGEVVGQLSESFAAKVEEAIIKGDGVKKPTGLVTSGVTVPLASKTAVTGDELIDIYHSIKAPYVPNASWLMSRDTLAKVRKLRDNDGQYLFQADLTKEFAGYILGKPVVVSEFMDNLGGTGVAPIMFGDFNKAYIVNANPQQTIQILNEVYATQGAKGVLGFLFLDGKPVNAECYAVAKTPAV